MHGGQSFASQALVDRVLLQEPTQKTSKLNITDTDLIYPRTGKIDGCDEHG